MRSSTSPDPSSRQTSPLSQRCTHIPHLSYVTKPIYRNIPKLPENLRVKVPLDGLLDGVHAVLLRAVALPRPGLRRDLDRLLPGGQDLALRGLERARALHLTLQLWVVHPLVVLPGLGVHSQSKEIVATLVV